MVDWNNEPSGHTCDACGNEPGNNYNADYGLYLCDNDNETLKTIVKNGYSVTDWMNEL
jgi:hypothetical protein